MDARQLKKILIQKISPDYLKVTDESHLHAGHAEAARSGGGHFSVVVVSEKFEGQPQVERHRLIYKIFKSQFPDIHALSIQALTPREWKLCPQFVADSKKMDGQKKSTSRKN